MHGYLKWHKTTTTTISIETKSTIYFWWQLHERFDSTRFDFLGFSDESQRQFWIRWFRTLASIRAVFSSSSSFDFDAMQYNLDFYANKRTADANEKNRNRVLCNFYASQLLVLYCFVFLSPSRKTYILESVLLTIKDLFPPNIDDFRTTNFMRLCC